MISFTSTITRTAWMVVILLMPVALLNYLDRQMMATMQSSVMKSIPSLGQALNPDELWGIMLGQFKWVYAIFSLIGGYIADRYSRRFTICGSLFVWSGVTCWTGQVTTYNQLLWARSLMGISEAFYIPAALALIANHHTGSTRSRAVGLHQMAIYLGVIAGGFGGYVASSPDLGWRFAFTACGILGMVYAIPLVLLLRDANQPSSGQVAHQPHRGSRRRSKGKRKQSRRGRHSNPGSRNVVRSELSPLQAARELGNNRSFWLLVLCFTLPAMAGWIVRDWMPSILKKQFHIGEGQAGVAATLYWQAAAIFGALIGATLADRWMRHRPRGRIYVSAIGMSLIVPAIFGVGNATSLGMAIAFLILFGLGWGFFDCNNMPILSQIVRPEFRATGYGIMNFVSISCGGFADWSFGVMRDEKVPLNVSFGVFAMLACVSIVLVLLIRPKPEFTRDERTSRS